MKQALNGDPARAGAIVDRERFDCVQDVILRVLPWDAQGMTWAELSEMIAPLLPDRLFRHMGTVRWYAKAVQLDLEARGVIERVPESKPPRLRRVA